MAVIVDAAGYFRTAHVAMLGARRRILLIGWDFDARIPLESGVDRPGEPKTLGTFMHWLVEREPEFEICVPRWEYRCVQVAVSRVDAVHDDQLDAAQTDSHQARRASSDRGVASPEDRHHRRCAGVDGGTAPARHAPAADVSTRGRPSIPWVLTFRQDDGDEALESQVA
jgi:hypothetical protein